MTAVMRRIAEKSLRFGEALLFRGGFSGPQKECIMKKYVKPILEVRKFGDILMASAEHDFYGEDIDLINKFNG